MLFGLEVLAMRLEVLAMKPHRSNKARQPQSQEAM
jgi:hypothetical protein